MLDKNTLIRTDVNLENEFLLNLDEYLTKSQDFTSVDDLYSQLKQQILKYHPSTDISMIVKAYNIAEKSHQGQVRKSGEPYIVHPLAVCIILAELQLDKETIVAGLLHDVVEDTVMTIDEISNLFGKDVAFLVDGVTKLNKMPYMEKIEVQAENFRKMFLAMADDIRVILIKLADRLHNMRTLKFQPIHKQIEIAQETIDIYTPISQKLGLGKIKSELEDLSLKYLDRDTYINLINKTSLLIEYNKSTIDDIINEIQSKISKQQITADVQPHFKHIFSLYRKMLAREKSVDEMYDFFYIQIIAVDVKDCYTLLGVIHEAYKPISNRFKDFIAMPKPNMYQCIHTTVIANNGQPIEVQIQTSDMKRIADFGITVSWKYREGKKENEEKKLNWLRQILEWQQDMADNKEFMNVLKSDLDLLSEKIYCFTPNGEVKYMPKGSNAIDFAYCIHSDIGNQMMGANVNGKNVPIDYILQNGDRIEVITSQNAKGPNPLWLNSVKSSQAKAKINQWIKRELNDSYLQQGEEIIDNYCREKAIVKNNILKDRYQNEILKHYGFTHWKAIVIGIGQGSLQVDQIINRLVDIYNKVEGMNNAYDLYLNKKLKESNSAEIVKKSGVIVKGKQDNTIRFSKCCQPIPGDEIIGLITNKRGISVHRTNCMNITGLPDSLHSSLIEVQWEPEENISEHIYYTTMIKIDVNNRIGIIGEILNLFTELDIQVVSINTSESKESCIYIAFEINNKKDFNYLIEKIKLIDDVIKIERM